MTNSGDAAEQIVRISLEGVDYAIRIVGSGAKNIAAFLLAAFKSDGTDGKTKLRGKERLVNMLKCGKETKIFAIKNSDLEQFAKEAKRYGVVYCVLKDKSGTPNGTSEVMAKAEDASKISRIMDRLEFAAVPLATVETTPTERETLDRDDADKLLDQLLGEDGVPTNDQPEADKAQDTAAKEQPQNPTPARSGAERPSEPRSEMPSLSAGDTRVTKKPRSVGEFLRERTAQNAKKREEKQPDRAEPDAKPKTQKTVPQHQQPPGRGKKNKSKNKERG
ncbi:MAG: DUF3801 domain-containing protein [Eubacteriales bacterium]|nr:DUF3801 domain-containing protein [Eubacteriales bacterium]